MIQVLLIILLFLVVSMSRFESHGASRVLCLIATIAITSAYIAALVYPESEWAAFLAFVK